MTEEYLRTKIIGIIQPMVNSLLIEMPANPEFFMLKWLQTYNLVENIRINKEREEFESLRSELNYYLRKEKEEKEIPLLGTVMVPKGVISLQNDRGSQYQAYLKVQNELQAAYNELRDELAKRRFGKTYDDCADDEKDAIRKVYPQKISEAEPKNYKK